MVNGPEDLDPSSDRRGVRWWPAAVIVVLGSMGMAGNVLREIQRQNKIMGGIAIALGVGACLLVWVVFFSRLPGRVRGGLALAAVVVLIAGAATVEVRGVSGDIVPILAWRWSAKPDVRPLHVDGGGEPSPVPEGAADWPRFLGPDVQPVTAGPRLARNWESDPPREVWRISIGSGWSGFSVVGGRAVTQEQRGEEELVTCYDLATGRPLWSHADSARFVDETGGTISGIGPRATPTLFGGRVYTMGATGLLNCLDVTTGEKIWGRNVLADHKGEPLEWGMAGSPLVWEDAVIINVIGSGRALAAYDRDTGEPLWHAEGEGASYSSPMPAFGQVVIVNSGSVSGHDPETGADLWRIDWPGKHPKVAQPVVIDEHALLISAGYGLGAAYIELDESMRGWEANVRWEKLVMKAKFSNMVLRDGLVYGLDDGILACIDPVEGRRFWKGGRYGHGQVILVDDLLLVQTEAGELVLVNATPDAHSELARINVFNHKAWNTPALAGQYLLMRTDRQAVCLELPTVD